MLCLSYSTTVNLPWSDLYEDQLLGRSSKQTGAGFPSRDPTFQRSHLLSEIPFKRFLRARARCHALTKPTMHMSLSLPPAAPSTESTHNAEPSRPEGSQLGGSQLGGSQLEGCVPEGSQLEGSQLEGSQLEGIRMKSASHIAYWRPARTQVSLCVPSGTVCTCGEELGSKWRHNEWCHSEWCRGKPR